MVLLTAGFPPMASTPLFNTMPGFGTGGNCGGGGGAVGVVVAKSIRRSIASMKTATLRDAAVDARCEVRLRIMAGLLSIGCRVFRRHPLSAGSGLGGFIRVEIFRRRGYRIGDRR